MNGFVYIISLKMKEKINSRLVHYLIEKNVTKSPFTLLSNGSVQIYSFI